MNKPHNKHSNSNHIIQNNFFPNLQLDPYFSKKIHITTRNNPEKNKHTVPIKKRNRGPDKKKMEKQDITTSQQTNTKTEETSNLGQGRQPLSDKEHFNSLPETDYDNSSEYLEQLHRVFGENFIAEATRSDKQSKNLQQMIEKKAWDTLKH